MVKGQRTRLGISELIGANKKPVHSNSRTVSFFFSFLFYLVLFGELSLLRQTFVFCLLFSGGCENLVE